MCRKIDDGSLDAPLLAEARGESTMASLRSRCNSVAGILMVTLAAILFGVVAAFVKATALPTLLMLQIRAILEWALGITVSILYHSNDQQQRKLQILPLPQPEAGLVHQRVHQRFGPKESPALSRFANEPSESTRSSLFLLLFGPSELRGWLALRAFLYWAFLAAWWLALSSMPIGDATTIVYCGPIFTALFARLFLGERIDWSFYPVVILDAIGLILITRPSFLFERDVTETREQSGDTAETAYLLGAASALFSAIVAGLLPVCTRISKQCFWTAVNHVSSALSAVVFTPLAFGIWSARQPARKLRATLAWPNLQPAASKYSAAPSPILLIALAT